MALLPVGVVFFWGEKVDKTRKKKTSSKDEVVGRTFEEKTGLLGQIVSSLNRKKTSRQNGIKTKSHHENDDFGGRQFCDTPSHLVFFEAILREFPNVA